MARARNIKPGFFVNEELVECGFATRLLFAGLWTLADREGRLEDRPKKIKMGVFPADSVDVDVMLGELNGASFITRYEVAGVKYIQINTWHKHQSPHHTEKDSVIPDINGAVTVKPPKQDGGNPPDSLIPDSLIPDSKKIPPTPRKREGRGAETPSLTARDLEASGVDAKTAVEFIALRNRRKATLTELALAGIKREAHSIGWTLNAALLKCVERGWQGFDASWVAKRTRAGPVTGMNRQEALEARNLEAAERAARTIQ